MWQLQSDAENISDQNCGVQTLEPSALKTDPLVPVGHIWKFVLEEYELRDFGKRFKNFENSN